MKKLFAGLVATTIVAAGTSAFAAVPVGNIVETTNTETVSAALPAEGKSGQMTVIVVKLAAPAEGSETVTVPADISDGDIYYIDQAAYTTDNMFENLKMKAGLEVGDYFMVRVGGENVLETGIAEAVYKVVADKPAGVEVQLGDANQSGAVEALDLISVLKHMADTEVLTGINAFAADANQSGAVEALDLISILKHMADTEVLGTATYVAE